MSPLVLSLQVATAGTLLALLGGVAAGALLSRERVPARSLLDAVLTAPLVLPPTVLGYYLLVLLGRRSALGQAFEALTGAPIVFTRTGAIVAAAIGAFPIVAKATRAALEDVDRDLVGAARTLGASPLRALWTIELPLARRGIVAATMLAFARALGDFGVTLMIGGDIPGLTQTASLAIYDALAAQRDDDARTLSLVLGLVAVALLWAVNALLTRRDAR